MKYVCRKCDKLMRQVKNEEDKKCILCDSCGSIFELDTKEADDLQAKESMIGALACVLSLFSWLCILGFIVAIIDILSNDKKTHAFSIIAIVISIIWFVVGMPFKVNYVWLPIK